MRMQVWSLGLLSELRSGVALSCSVGSRCSLDPMLLWLWCRPVCRAPAWLLAWELPYASGVAPTPQKKDWLKRLRLVHRYRCVISSPMMESILGPLTSICCGCGYEKRKKKTSISLIWYFLAFIYVFSYTFAAEFIVCLFMYYLFFCFLGPHLWQMEVPRLGVELELQLRTYTQPKQCRIWAASVTYSTAHGHAGFPTHWARPWSNLHPHRY